MALPAENVLYTYTDYLSWDNNGERFELINGEAIMMAPAPSHAHQSISMSIAGQLYAYLRGKQCEVLTAPYDVRLFEQEGAGPEDIDTVVQPDIVVICDKNKIDQRGCKGAPDLIIEILSPCNRPHDKLTKFNLYQKAGVREYWIVDPEDKTVQAFVLENGHYIVKQVGGVGDKMKVNVLDDFNIDLSEAFGE